MQLDDRGYKKYWDQERETLDPAQREKLILERIKHQLAYVYNELPFYRRHYDEHGFKPDDVRTLEDFTTKVPVIKKSMLVADQREHPVFGSYSGRVHRRRRAHPRLLGDVGHADHVLGVAERLGALARGDGAGHVGARRAPA